VLELKAVERYFPRLILWLLDFWCRLCVPSSTIRIFLSFDGLTVAMKCFSHCTNTSDVIHPLSVHANLAPGGAPSDSSCLKRSLLKITIGGAKFPAALMQHTHVAFVPLSPLVMVPT
jgi:hypothetical protein